MIVLEIAGKSNYSPPQEFINGHVNGELPSFPNPCPPSDGKIRIVPRLLIEPGKSINHKDIKILEKAYEMSSNRRSRICRFQMENASIRVFLVLIGTPLERLLDSDIAIYSGQEKTITRENHKGTRATMVYQFAQQMQKGNPKLFKFGEQKRDYIYVKDVVTANILASKAKESGIVNCGSGTAISFNEIVEQLNFVLALNRKPEYIDNPFEGAYQNYTECDMSLAKEKLGFVPEYTFEKGLMD